MRPAIRRIWRHLMQRVVFGSALTLLLYLVR
jgi:hypothetical protein